MNAANSAYQRYVNARFEIEQTQLGEYTPGALKEMQAAMLEALQSGAPLPEEMRLHLLFGFEHLCAGVEFDLFTPVKRPGGREPPILKKTQDAAIRYLRWCEDGRIKDLSPNSSVGSAYGVSTRTVANWRKAWGEKPLPSLRPMESYGEGDQAAEAARVANHMRINGKQYQRFRAMARRKT